eukprot:jgi/Ulvmu1/11000/UM007_0180.1
MAQDDIKYLSFVQRGAVGVFDIAAHGYDFAKRTTVQITPKGVDGMISGTEEHLQPVLESYFTLSQSILKLMDTMVEASVGFGSEVVSRVQTTSKSAVEGIQSRVKDTVPKDLMSDMKSTAQSRYTSAHDAVVSNPTYAQLYQKAVEYAKWISSFSVVQKSAGVVNESVYPRVKGVVDPVRSTMEPYVKAIEDHLEPRSAVVSDASSEQSSSN